MMQLKTKAKNKLLTVNDRDYIPIGLTTGG